MVICYYTKLWKLMKFTNHGGVDICRSLYSQERDICEKMKKIKGINSSPPGAAYIRWWIRSALVQIMACRLFGAKPLSEPMLGYCQLDPKVFSEILIKIQNFSFTKMHLKMLSAKWRPCCPGEDELATTKYIQQHSNGPWRQLKSGHFSLK